MQKTAFTRFGDQCCAANLRTAVRLPRISGRPSGRYALIRVFTPSAQCAALSSTECKRQETILADYETETAATTMLWRPSAIPVR